MSESETEGKVEYRNLLAGVLSHLQELEWRILIALALIAGGSWLFFELAGVVFDDEPGFRSMDEALVLALREPDDRSDPIGSPLVETAVRDITALGGTAVLTLLTASSAVFLILRGNYRTAFVLIVAVVGGTLLSMLFKDVFARPRPSLVPVETRHLSYSFPSGHAMVSAITYLTVGALLAHTQARRAIKIYILTLAVLLAAAVGISRIYLGLHWPTDVIAGWLAGVSWALAVLLIAHFWN